MHVGNHEVRTDEVEAGSEESGIAACRALRREDAVRERIVDDAFNRRPAAIERVDDVGRHREAVELQVVVVGVDVIQTPAAAHHQFLFQQVGEADARLDVVPIGVGRDAANTINTSEVQAALQLRQIGKLRAVYEFVRRVDDVRIEAVIEAVITLVRRLIDVPAHAEVKRQPAVHLPIVLEPGRVILAEVGREEVVLHPAANIAEQECGDAVAASRVARIPASCCVKPRPAVRRNGLPSFLWLNCVQRMSTPARHVCAPRIQVNVRVCGDGVRDVVARIPAYGSVAVARLVTPEHYAARQRVDQRRRESERRTIEAHVFVGHPLLLEAVEGDAEVEDEGRREGRQMVGHERVVETLERQLAALPDGVHNAVFVAVLAPIVLGKAQIHPVLLVELLVNFGHPVPESVGRQVGRKEEVVFRIVCCRVA